MNDLLFRVIGGGQTYWIFQIYYHPDFYFESTDFEQAMQRTIDRVDEKKFAIIKIENRVTREFPDPFLELATEALSLKFQVVVLNFKGLFALLKSQLECYSERNTLTEDEVFNQ